jgi:hypothetical protein
LILKTLTQMTENCLGNKTHTECQYCEDYNFHEQVNMCDRCYDEFKAEKEEISNMFNLTDISGNIILSNSSEMNCEIYQDMIEELFPMGTFMIEVTA